MTRLCVALDVPSVVEALRVINQLRGLDVIYKVGPALLCHDPAAWPWALKLSSQQEVFLDLKLHDIPSVVARAVDGLARFSGVAWLTTHAQDGCVAAAVEGLAGRPRPGILAVTVLTTNEADPDAMARRARGAKDAGAHGIICSPRDLGLVTDLPKSFVRVCPGIRPDGDAAGDQHRSVTPREAKFAGADIIVVGRPIVAAARPGDAARAILADLVAP